MIATNQQNNIATVTVFGEFTLADYKEFEELFNFSVKFTGSVHLLFDLRQMADFTVDMAWEEIKFARAHAHDFGRIAVLTDSQWVAWSAWLSQAFVNADLRVFANEEEARAWLEEADEE